MLPANSFEFWRGANSMAAVQGADGVEVRMSTFLK
jgi:hypothetical protein